MGGIKRLRQKCNSQQIIFVKNVKPLQKLVLLSGMFSSPKNISLVIIYIVYLKIGNYYQYTEVPHAVQYVYLTRILLFSSKNTGILFLINYVFFNWFALPLKISYDGYIHCT